jgi:drug/metabolite transporter (DMT)-like permease
VVLAFITAVLWGTVPVAGKVALGGMSAPLLCVLRLGLAGAFLAFIITRRSRLGRPPRLVYLAALGLGGNYLFYLWGLEHAGAAASQVLIQTAPLFLVILGVLVLGERPSRLELAGGVVAFAGVALVSWQEITSTSGGAIGVGLILISAFTWSVYAAAHKALGRKHGSTKTMAWIFLLAALVLVPTTPFGPWRSPDPVQAIAIAFLCLNTMVAYWAFAEALRHIRATTAAVIATIGPAVTFGLLAISNSLDQDYLPYEPITLTKIAGAVLVMAGVGVAVTARR